MSIVVPAAVTARVLSRYDEVDSGWETPCWLTTYATYPTGYGQVGWKDSEGRRRNTTTHTVAWVAERGPVSAGMTIEHRCGEKRCVRVSHMREISRGARSARAKAGYDWPLDWACRRNHDPNDRMITAGGRSECAACHRIAVRKHDAKRQAEQKAERIANGTYRKPGRPKGASDKVPRKRPNSTA